jgi:hypothetical protein
MPVLERFEVKRSYQVGKHQALFLRNRMSRRVLLRFDAKDERENGLNRKK